jgi:hypothetical protein
MAWLNENSGVAARNGTDTHTVPFGFTSTSGSLLVFIAAGSVTHDASGWTQQLAPVQFAELAVFTKVSVGDDEIVVTHNSDNYPMDWQIFEFAEDSTYLDGAEEATGGSGDSRTWPVLSGLTSNPKTIIAAVCRSSGLASGTASIASWAITTNELRDLLTLGNATEGIYHGVAYEEDVTATSVTPTATMTVGGVPFSGSAQYQMVVFAIDDADTGELTETITEAVGVTDAAITAKDIAVIIADDVGVTDNAIDELIAGTQSLRPDSDITVGGWTPTPSSPTTLFDKIDEVTASDTDYISET